MKWQFGGTSTLRVRERTEFLQMRSLSLKRSRLQFQPSCFFFFWSEKSLDSVCSGEGFLEAGGQLPSTSAGLEM